MKVTHCLLSKDHDLVLYAAEKANCTEVAEMFFRHCGLLEEALRYSPWIHNYKWEVYHPTNMVYLSDLLQNKYYQVKFVRCPYERAVSSYIHWRAYCNGHGKSFMQFLEEISTRIFRYKDTCDGHWATQMFLGESKVRWDGAVHIENMDEDLARLRQPFPKRIDNRFKSPHWKKNSEAVTSNRFRGAEALDTIDNLYYPDLYNQEVREMVEASYKVDFDRHPEYTFDKFLARFQCQWHL